MMDPIKMNFSDDTVANFDTLPIKIYRPDKTLALPFTKDPLGNAGYDLYATETLTVAPGQIIKVPVNARFSIPTGYFGFVVPRSGLSSEGINIIPGTIDSNFTGQIQAIVQNLSGSSFQIDHGLRIAQIIYMRHEIPTFIEVDSVDELGVTTRGDKGFGESGKF